MSVSIRKDEIEQALIDMIRTGKPDVEELLSVVERTHTLWERPFLERIARLDPEPGKKYALCNIGDMKNAVASYEVSDIRFGSEVGFCGYTFIATEGISASCVVFVGSKDEKPLYLLVRSALHGGELYEDDGVFTFVRNNRTARQPKLGIKCITCHAKAIAKKLTEEIEGAPEAVAYYDRLVDIVRARLGRGAVYVDAVRDAIVWEHNGTIAAMASLAMVRASIPDINCTTCASEMIVAYMKGRVE